MKRSRIFLCITLVALMLLSSIAFVACDEGESVTGISSVELRNGEVTLKATLEESYASDHSKDTLYVLALPAMQADGSLKEAEVVAEGKAKKSMTFKFPITDLTGESRVACAFVLAEKNGGKYSALTDFAYISNPESLASKSEGPASTSSIKGIACNDPALSLTLGAEHIVAVADMGKLIVEDFAPETVRFNYGEITYFYNEKEVELLDKTVNEAKASGIRVYIRTVLTSKNAAGILPDLENAETVRYVKAFYAFLASRYAVSDYIIGDRVNDYTKYCKAQGLETEEFERVYSYWARLANNVLKSVNSSAKIYVPVDNSWKSDGKNGVIGAQAFLSHFASNAKSGGDYDYAVALNLGVGDDITALLKDEGYNYSKIGAINLSEFSDFIDKSEMRYKSERRDMIIDGLDLSSVSDSKNRAAYYTLAYYTAAQQGFDAFIYSGSLFGNNNSRGDMYFAFMMCGTGMSSQLTQYTNRLKGAYVPNFDEYVSNNLTYVQNASTDISEQVAKKQKQFPARLSDFEVFGDIKNFQGKSDIIDGNRWLVEGDLSAMHGGIIATSIPAEDIVNSRYIGVLLDGDAGQNVYLVLKKEGGDSAAYTLVGECKASNNYCSFDLTEFTKGIESSDAITVAICIIPNGDEEASLEVIDISLYGSSANNTETIIVIVVVVVILLALVGLIVLLAIKRKKRASEAHDD